MPQSNGDRAACAVIFQRKVLKADVIALAMRLPREDINDAAEAFRRQGPRLWGFWVAAVNARIKADAGWMHARDERTRASRRLIASFDRS